MPELPEVETVRRSLAPMVGRRIVAARLHRPDVCTTATGRRPRPEELLVAARVESLARHGKQLAILASGGRVLVVHLGMSGQLRLLPRGGNLAQRDHIHADWMLDDGSLLIFRDPRRFGGLWTLESQSALRDRWSTLGPDALTMKPADLHTAATGSARAIKALLLDQTAIAGIGNIYADEALFAAGIRPARRASSLTAQERLRLARAIKTVLERAVEARGSSLRDYMDADGRRGEAQLRHAVYGRSGLECLRCRKPLRTSTIAQRTTVYCPNCQS